MKKTIQIFTALFLILAILAGGYAFRKQAQTYPSLSIASEIEQPFFDQFLRVQANPEPRTLPAFTYLTAKGEERSSQSLKGRYTLLNFWASWCAPCLKELPSLNALFEQYPDITVKAISLDSGQTMDRLITFIDQKNIPALAHFWDHKRVIQSQIPMRGIPTTLLIDPQGQILYSFEGDIDWMSSQTLSYFKALASQSSL